MKSSEVWPVISDFLHLQIRTGDCWGLLKKFREKQRLQNTSSAKLMELNQQFLRMHDLFQPPLPNHLSSFNEVKESDSKSFWFGGRGSCMHGEEDIKCQVVLTGKSCYSSSQKKTSHFP